MKNFLLILFILIFLGCAVWPIGDDPKGKKLREQANEIVSLIVKYKADKKRFPTNLSGLVPNYIKKLPAIVQYTSYSSEKGTFVYDYLPSWPQMGRTSCVTVVGSGEWNCIGYI